VLPRRRERRVGDLQARVRDPDRARRRQPGRRGHLGTAHVLVDGTEVLSDNAGALISYVTIFYVRHESMMAAGFHQVRHGS